MAGAALRGSATQGVVVDGWVSGPTVLGQTAQPIEPVLLPPRSRRRIAELAADTIGAISAMFRTRTRRQRPRREQYPPRREDFVEEPAMRREMFRL